MRRHLTRLAISLVLAAGTGLVLRAQDPGAATEEAAPGESLRWPRVVVAGDTTFTVYQPQIDKFEDAMLEARAAVKVDTKVGDKTQTSYGVVWITAQTQIDKENDLVELSNIQVPKANFPTAPERTEEFLETFRKNTEATRTISLERVEANLAVTQADRKGNAVPLKNDPPAIYYRSTPALLVLIDGDPALRPVEGASGLQRVVNTKSLILEAGGTYYMSLADRWLQAQAATGPWQLAASAPGPVTAVRDAIAKDENQTQVDLLEDPGEEIKAVLAEGKSPEIIVSTSPAELIVTNGKPQMKPIAGTQLLYVENTTGDIFIDLKDQSYYVTLTGRWYRSKSLEKGPWQFVEGDRLPPDFAKIPENDPKASVLATVPGTPAAQEAVIANSIPQTAEVNREEAKYEVQVRRRAEVRRRPGHLHPVRRQLPHAGRARLADVVLLRAGRRLVHGRLGIRAVGGGDRRPARDLHDPDREPDPLRHLRARLPLHAHDRVVRLHAGLPRNLLLALGNRRLRHRLVLPAMDRELLVRGALDLGLRRRNELEPVDRLERRLRVGRLLPDLPAVVGAVLWLAPAAASAGTVSAALPPRLRPPDAVPAGEPQPHEHQRLQPRGHRAAGCPPGGASLASLDASGSRPARGEAGHASGAVAAIHATGSAGDAPRAGPARDATGAVASRQRLRRA